MSGKRARRDRNASGLTDPRLAGGDYAGPGGPLDRDAIVVDTTRSVLLDQCAGLTVAVGHQGKTSEAVALVLEGRINQSSDRAKHLYLTDIDGAVAVVAELMHLLARAGRKAEFMDALTLHLAELDREVYGRSAS